MIADVKKQSIAADLDLNIASVRVLVLYSQTSTVKHLHKCTGAVVGVAGDVDWGIRVGFWR